MSTQTQEKNFIKNFAPSWFAIIMGTGVLAIDSLVFSRYFLPLKGIAYILFYLNIILFILFLIPWILRWILYFEDAYNDLIHPIKNAFYPTIAIGLMVLAADFLIIGKNVSVAKTLWWIGSLGTVFFSFLVPYYLFRSESVKIDHVNPGWYIPPVGLIVIPIAGGLLLNYISPSLKEFAVLLNYFGWGAGFFLYLAFLAIVIYRFILHHPLPSTLAPTIWINLGPIGAGIVSLVNLISNSSFVSVKEPFYVFSLLFWGFGIWWFVMALIMLIHYLKNLNLSFAMTWWAFIFPLGAYVASCNVLYKIFKFSLISHIGFLLYLLLLFMWTINFFKTLIGVLKREII